MSVFRTKLQPSVRMRQDGERAEKKLEQKNLLLWSKKLINRSPDLWSVLLALIKAWI